MVCVRPEIRSHGIPEFLWDGKNPVKFLSDRDRKNHRGSWIHGKI